MQRHHQGIHLIELLIVLAVLAILANVAIPSMQLMIERHRIKNAAEHVLLEMHTARRNALQFGQTVYIQYSPQSSCFATSRQQPCDCTHWSACAPDMALSRTTLRDYPGVNMHTSFTAHQTFFNSDRGIAGRLGKLELSSAHYQLHLVLSLHRIRLCVPASSQALPGYLAC